MNLILPAHTLQRMGAEVPHEPALRQESPTLDPLRILWRPMETSPLPADYPEGRMLRVAGQATHPHR